jgi:hypothetical protein
MPWKNGKIEPFCATLQADNQDLHGLASSLDAWDARRSRGAGPRSAGDRLSLPGPPFAR